jgi:signal transduction histidine kinase
VESVHVPFEHPSGERLIAGARVALALFALLVVWIDPDLTRDSRELLPVTGLFLLYAVLLALVSRREALRSQGVRVGLQLADFFIFSIMIQATHASVSPFFIFFLFSLVTALLRFGVRAMLLTGASAILVYVAMALSDDRIRGDPGYLLMRSASLAVETLLLARLGSYYERVSRELLRLASWPRTTVQTRESVVRDILDASRDLLRTRRVLLIWDDPEEPWANVALLDREAFSVRQESPEILDAMSVADPARREFLLAQREGGGVTVIGTDGISRAVASSPIAPAVAERFAITSALCAAVQADTANGFLLFLDEPALSVDDLAIAAVAARLVGASLDQLNATTRLRDAAVAEERLRMGRDLHDGVLQSFTGIALQVETIRRTMAEDPASARRRLETLQELIASDQRELRSLISELRTDAAVADFETRLGELSRRFEQQWDLKVELSVAPGLPQMSAALAAELYSTVAEAVANAAKHARPRVVRVRVETEAKGIHIVVEDDGTGFPFGGSYTLAQLNRLRRGPVTLKERVASLRGDLHLETRPGSTRLDIRIPPERRVPAERTYA